MRFHSVCSLLGALCLFVLALPSSADITDGRKDFRALKFLGPTPIDNVTWLPLKQPLVANSYPLTGTWSEGWSVTRSCVKRQI